MTGTLTYREPHTLTADAFAVVALVRGSARVTENTIVASEIDQDITAVPVSFSLDLGGAEIDPSSTYTIQATIVDGDDAWVTAHGVPVLTKGNPSKVAITLDFRPDVLKGAVSGQITGIGVQPSETAYGITVLVDPSTGDSLGIDVKTVDQGLPVAFSVPYSITDVEPTADYVVTAEVGDSTGIWRNAAGVPVITKGNPKAGVQVVVTQVSTPVPSATPIPTPAPSAPDRHRTWRRWRAAAADPPGRHRRRCRRVPRRPWPGKPGYPDPGCRCRRGGRRRAGDGRGRDRRSHDPRPTEPEPPTETPGPPPDASRPA